ncbi:MAG: hypothetical protein WCR07_09700 [Verrucomicrobiota bacterium]|jgi:hypothetical protein
MSHASDERFKELAMKLVSFECSAEEKAELRRIIDQSLARREELQKLCLSVGIARELLPLANALEATEGRMTAGELEAFKGALARRREEKRRESGAAAAGTSGESNRGPSIIDAQVVPDKPFNGYKLGFYVLLLLVLIASCIVLLKSCGTTKEKAGDIARTPVAESGNNRGEANSSGTDSGREQQPTATTLREPRAESKTARQELDSKAPAKTSKLGNYRGGKWVKLLNDSSKPGSRLYFGRFVGPNLTTPLVEGMRAQNGGVPNKFMLFAPQGNSWDFRSFPDVMTEAKIVVALDPSKILVADSGLQRAFQLIEKDQALEIKIPGDLGCIGAHLNSEGELFLHDFRGAVCKVSGGTASWLENTDPKAYIHEGGNPTEMRRGFIRNIAKADTGETVGVFYRDPPNIAMGPAALVEFRGDLWNMVCSLGGNYPGSVIHYLSKDSLLAALNRQFLIVKGGTPRMLGFPDGVESRGLSEWKAIRGASTDDFLAVQSSGAVYHYSDGRFDRQVAPDPVFQKNGAWQGDGAGGLRSVLITPDGTIYGIQSPTVWSRSIIYKLVPQ